MEFDPIQQAELDRLNKALKENEVKDGDRKKLIQKRLNPKTGELQVVVDNGKGGAWPFLVGGVICLVNSVNERDLSLLTSDALLEG